MITNQYELPERFITAVTADQYTRGEADYSITELLNPPQVSLLSRRYAESIDEDITEHLWKMFGNAMHFYLEQYAGSAVTEKRFYAGLNGKIITGQVDSYIADGVLDDYKVTSTYTVQRKSRLAEWTMQVNGYAWLLKSNGIEVKELRIIAIMRDWMLSKRKKDGKYPPCQVAVIPITKLPDQEVIDYFSKRIDLYELNKNVPDSLLKECAADEHWGWKRCEDYCGASPFCVQYNKHLESI